MNIAFLLRYEESNSTEAEPADRHLRAQTQTWGSGERPQPATAQGTDLPRNRSDGVKNTRTKTAVGGGDHDRQGDAVSAVLPKSRQREKSIYKDCF